MTYEILRHDKTLFQVTTLCVSLYLVPLPDMLMEFAGILQKKMREPGKKLWRFFPEKTTFFPKSVVYFVYVLPSKNKKCSPFLDE